MYNNNKRTSIFEGFFALPGNRNNKMTNELFKKIDEYLMEYSSDTQMRDLRKITRAYNMSIKFKDFERPNDIIESIFNRLLKKDLVWDLYDIRILASIINYHKDYNNALILSNRIIKELEAYSDHKDYNHIRFTLHLNILPLLYYAKYENKHHENISNKIDKHFKHQINQLEEISKLTYTPNNGTDPMILVRKGIYYEDPEMTQKGLYLLRKVNLTEYNALKTEIREIESFRTLGYNSSILRRRIGNKVRDMRIKSGMTIPQLSKETQLESRFLVAVEQGNEILKEAIKQTLVNVFSCSHDDLSLMPTELYNSDFEYKDHLFNSIKLHLATFDKDQLKYTVYFMDRLENKKNNKQGILELFDKILNGEYEDED